MSRFAITNQKLTLAIGLSAMVAAFIIERFLPSTDGLNFITGFLGAMSIAFNLNYLTKLRKKAV